MTMYHVISFAYLQLYEVLSGAISSSNRHTENAHAHVLDEWQLGLGLSWVDPQLLQ